MRRSSWAGQAQQIAKIPHRRKVTWTLVVFVVSGAAMELGTPGARNRARSCAGGSTFVSMRGHRSVQAVSACSQREFQQEFMIKPVVSGPTCVDENEHCAIWESWGECTNNPEYMLSSCELSCGACPTFPVGDIDVQFLSAVVLWLGCCGVPVQNNFAFRPFAQYLISSNPAAIGLSVASWLGLDPNTVCFRECELDYNVAPTDLLGPNGRLGPQQRDWK
jgi:hypothetical protein